MSAEIPGDQPEESEQLPESERLYDLFYELDEQICTGERQGVGAVNEYIRLQRDLNRELARTRPADYFKYNQRAEHFERILNGYSYEGKAKLCSDEAEGHKALVWVKNRDRYDPTKTEDSKRDETIKKIRIAAANWLR